MKIRSFLSLLFRTIGHSLVTAGNVLDGLYDADTDEHGDEVDVNLADFPGPLPGDPEPVERPLPPAPALPPNARQIAFVGGPHDGLAAIFVPPMQATIYLPVGDVTGQVGATAALATPSPDRPVRYDLDGMRYVFVPTTSTEA